MSAYPRILLVCGLAAAAATAQRNVLLICVDDLRPELGCYGEPAVQTPHLDRLAAAGCVFTHHYAQVPTCGASRLALLAGRHPRTARALGNGAFAELPRSRDARATTLPGWFRDHGYTTIALGKVSHSPDGRRIDQNSGEGDGEPEVPFDWHVVDGPRGRWGTSWNAFFGYADGSTRRRGQSPPRENADVGDDGYPDGLIAEQAIETLRALATGERPFLLAVGFFKPHLPFCAPLRDLDRVPAELPPVPAPEPPRGVDPAISLHRGGELFGNYAHPDGARDDHAYLDTLRRGYLACVGYADRQVGRVLAELDRLGMTDDTVVVVWGDHGWHLGDLGVWGKHTLHERALRSALLIRAPDHAPRRVDTVVSSVDLLPTLAALCTLPPPPGDGADLGPLLRAGDGGERTALGFWRRGAVEGRTLRTADWRLTEWRRGGAIVQTELYDHRGEGEAIREEDDNVAPAHDEIVTELRERLWAAPPLLR